MRTDDRAVTGDAAAPCPNCGAPLQGAYCAECGQRRLLDADRRLGPLLGQLFGAFTNFDNRVWRTFRALFFRPGRLSSDYIAGRRARWLPPISLFVIANLLFFLAPSLSDFTLPFDDQVPGPLALAARDDADRLSPATRARIEQWPGQLHSHVTARWVQARVANRDAAARARTDGRTGYTVADYARAYNARAVPISKVLIILHVPFVALVLAAAFRRRPLYFAEHLVVALHLFTFYVLLIQLVVGPLAYAERALGGAWSAALDQTWRALVLALSLAYTTVALRTVYATAWWRAAAAAAALLLVLLAANYTVYRAVQFVAVFAVT
ncbi:DUF3667 domain-containing protein [Luteimonas sp BLCC-B24]|uniref:DUF3667 domain-containing protein n=1 Tax=Luteimonas sp. BLCC-B24 TaxID=3025317 RepID=UPI00234DC811|nr:DUF3667 domain-containing protein [Luteimonas sp. BLCC-B24]MDC7807121.1 DUF3667 domain-containing protein [Luteimonas sp. BLCC-B24]